jgi:hypothetical protein
LVSTNYGELGHYCRLHDVCATVTGFYILRFLLGVAEAGFSLALFFI